MNAGITALTHFSQRYPKVCFAFVVQHPLHAILTLPIEGS